MASPLATSCSSANWRIVSNIENRVRPADRSAVTSDLRTSESNRSNTAYSSIGSGYRAGAARSNPSAKTEQRCSTDFFVVVEQVVGPCHRVAQRLVAFQPAP